jgi:hypothetical protein
MRSRFSIPAAVLAVVLLLSASCCADEDGFFCTGRGYLAYNLRSGITPDVIGHVLKIVRFESKRGIYFAGQVSLQDFQVHRMVCNQDYIEISGYGNSFKKYTIAISGTPGPQIAEFIEDAVGRFDPSKDGPEPLWFSGDNLACGRYLFSQMIPATGINYCSRTHSSPQTGA